MAKQDTHPGLGGDEAVVATEPGAERRPRVLMLVDMTTDMRETDHEVDSVRSAQSTTTLLSFSPASTKPKP